jgi:hypothetical protein
MTNKWQRQNVYIAIQALMGSSQVIPNRNQFQMKTPPMPPAG